MKNKSAMLRCAKKKKKEQEALSTCCLGNGAFELFSFLSPCSHHRSPHCLRLLAGAIVRHALLACSCLRILRIAPALLNHA